MLQPRHLVEGLWGCQPLEPITLTDDAKEALLEYRFPGNTRQLKNLVEQISVLSTDQKEITSEVLRRYLPKENSLPALYKTPGLWIKTAACLNATRFYKVLFNTEKKDVPT